LSTATNPEKEKGYSVMFSVQTPGRASERRTLVLNADMLPLATYPLSTIPVQKAISAVVRDRVNVVDTWDEEFRSPTVTMLLPKVIALRDYAHVHAAPKFCRRSVILRDRFCCQYCGTRFVSEDLTFDHVIPRSAGGKTVWENILSACVPCNIRKRNTMPNYSGSRKNKKGSDAMRPLKIPRQPTAHELLQNGLEFLDAESRENWASWLYWNTELETE
jgi:5-methylcytosine-specific restriction endonuclease McrA